jgi:hypothetical protein
VRAFKWRSRGMALVTKSRLAGETRRVEPKKRFVRRLVLVGWSVPPVLLCSCTPAITRKGIPLTPFRRRFTRVGLLGGTVVVAGLVGCDSTPTSPTDPSSATAEKGVPKKGFKAFQSHATGKPQQLTPKQEGARKP